MNVRSYFKKYNKKKWGIDARNYIYWKNECHGLFEKEISEDGSFFSK